MEEAYEMVMAEDRKKGDRGSPAYEAWRKKKLEAKKGCVRR